MSNWRAGRASREEVNTHLASYRRPVALQVAITSLEDIMSSTDPKGPEKRKRGWGGPRPNSGGKREGSGRPQQRIYLDQATASLLRDLAKRWNASNPSEPYTPDTVAEDLIERASAARLGPSELSLWRAGAYDDVIKALWQRATSGAMTQAEYDRIGHEAFRAQVERNDEQLKAMLCEYCPDGDRIARYPVK